MATSSWKAGIPEMGHAAGCGCHRVATVMPDPARDPTHGALPDHLSFRACGDSCAAWRASVWAEARCGPNFGLAPRPKAPTCVPITPGLWAYFDREPDGRWPIPLVPTSAGIWAVIRQWIEPRLSPEQGRLLAQELEKAPFWREAVGMLDGSKSATVQEVRACLASFGQPITPATVRYAWWRATHPQGDPPAGELPSRGLLITSFLLGPAGDVYMDDGRVLVDEAHALFSVAGDPEWMTKEIDREIGPCARRHRDWWRQRFPAMRARTARHGRPVAEVPRAEALAVLRGRMTREEACERELTRIRGQKEARGLPKSPRDARLARKRVADRLRALSKKTGE